MACSPKLVDQHMHCRKGSETRTQFIFSLPHRVSNREYPKIFRFNPLKNNGYYIYHFLFLSMAVQSVCWALADFHFLTSVHNL
jgi:hypothetical protein